MIDFDVMKAAAAYLRQIAAGEIEPSTFGSAVAAKGIEDAVKHINAQTARIAELESEVNKSDQDNETLVSINSELATELEALREQEIEINDDMALAFHHAISDGALGSDDIEEIKTGLKAAFSHINSAPAAMPDYEPSREELYRIANHIAGAKNGLPDEWQSWADDIEASLRKLLRLNSGNKPK